VTGPTMCREVDERPPAGPDCRSRCSRPRRAGLRWPSARPSCAGGGRSRPRWGPPAHAAAGPAATGERRGRRGIIGVQVGERLVVESGAAWHAWLAAHHATAREIWLISYRRSPTARSLGHAIACDEAICFGWLAGPSEMLDDDSYATRFRPRVQGGDWSDGDLARARRLARAGRLLIDGIAVLPQRIRETWGCARVAAAADWTGDRCGRDGPARGYVPPLRPRPTNLSRCSAGDRSIVRPWDRERSGDRAGASPPRSGSARSGLVPRPSSCAARRTLRRPAWRGRPSADPRGRWPAFPTPGS
jgi:hypothetical protein